MVAVEVVVVEVVVTTGYPLQTNRWTPRQQQVHWRLATPGRLQ